MNQDFYNVEAIIGEVLRSHIDISPTDRQEWKLFCCALKVLGYDESTFVALSSGKQSDSRKAWRDEKNPTRYVATEDKAKAKIIALAKGVGMDLKPFLLSQYRNDTRSNHRPTSPTRKPVTVKPQPVNISDTLPRYYIPGEMIDQGANKADETGLYKFLCGYYSQDEVNQVFARYRVGASKFQDEEGNKAASFPMINRQGVCIDCKIFHIHPKTGSRKGLYIFPPTKKNPNGLTSTFALAMMKDPDRPGERLKDRRGDWAYFGEHLLTEGKPVAVVESEKTAIIAALEFPGFTWIATGSISNLNPDRFKPLSGFDITIFPDRDGVQTWKEKAQELANQGFKIRIDTTVTRYPGNPKDDLADVIIRSRQGTQEKPQESPETSPKAISHLNGEKPAEATAEAPGGNKDDLLDISLCGDTWESGFVPLSWRIPEPQPKHGEAWNDWLINRMCWRSEQARECRGCVNAILQDGVYFRRCRKKISQEEAASLEVCRGFQAKVITEQPRTLEEAQAEELAQLEREIQEFEEVAKELAEL